MDGWILVDMILSKDPVNQGIIVSGRQNSSETVDPQYGDRVGFLSKPLDPADLGRRIALASGSPE